jgi:hypothetical protein
MPDPRWSARARTEVIRSSRSDQRQALAAADGSVPFSRCEPDKARRHGWRRGRLRRTATAVAATAGATTAATAASLPRLRSNSRRLRPLRWRRCRDRPGWCPGLRRRRRWCRNLWRVRGDLVRGNRSDKRGEHYAIRVTVRPAVPVAARHEIAAAHQVWQPHHTAARRFLPRGRPPTRMSALRLVKQQSRE